MTFDNNNNQTPPLPPSPVAPPVAQAPGAPFAAGPQTGVAPEGPAPKKRNTLGLVSIILAVVGFALAIIPFFGVVGWPLLIAALVLGIIGLTRKGQPKGTSIAGLALSVLAMILAPIIALAWFVGSVEEAQKTDVDTSTSADSADDAEPAEESAEAAGSSRDNPAPIGSTISGDEWDVVVNSVTLGATDAVLAADNAFNEAPAEGSEFILINITTTYTGDDKGMPAFVSVGYVTPEGNTIDGLEDFVIAPEPLDTLSELYNGASATGNIVLTVPSATADQGVLVITPGLLNDDVFVAVK